MNPVVITVLACLASTHSATLPLFGWNGLAPFNVQTLFNYAPAFTSTQYHAQDEIGQASFGYSHAGQAASNFRDAFGNQVGSWAYINPEGKEVRVSYVADVNGFRVVSNDLPQAPSLLEVTLPVGPAPVQETPEVAAARAAHLAAVAEAKARNAAVASGHGDLRRKRDVAAFPIPLAHTQAFHGVTSFSLAHATPFAEVFRSVNPLVHSVSAPVAAPLAHSLSPVVHSVAPVVHSVTPLAHSVAPVANYKAPIVYSAVPVAHHVAPAVHSIVPLAHAVVSAAHDVAPVVHSVAPVVHSVPAPVAVATPAASVTKYHSQDELGQAAFGHATHDQTHNAVRDAFGNQMGSYSYINDEGKEVFVHYTAGVGGFRVLSNALPQAPAPGAEVAPSLVEDTEEVKAARAKFFEAFEEARNRIKHD